MPSAALSALESICSVGHDRVVLSNDIRFGLWVLGLWIDGTERVTAAFGAERVLVRECVSKGVVVGSACLIHKSFGACLSKVVYRSCAVLRYLDVYMGRSVVCNTLLYVSS